MNIVINEALKAYIDPLTPDEHAALERSILAEGCRDALVLWGDMLVDGHNRYGICQQHGLPFQTVQNPHFQSIEDVHLWMIDQHLGRRSVSDFQRGVLALRKREIVAQRKARVPETSPGTDTPAPRTDLAPSVVEPDTLSSRESVAKAARLSSSQVVMIEKIQKQAAPELVAAVKSGTISLNAAAAVATLPIEEQAAAATAGKQELKQAAKRVREARRKPREAGSSDSDHALADNSAAAAALAPPDDDELARLRLRVEELTAENAELRRQLARWHAEGAPHSTSAF